MKVRSRVIALPLPVFLCAAVLIIMSGGQARADVFTVMNTNDSGAGSLRQAIIDANAAPGVDVIEFSIPGAGPHTISPLSVMPYITDSLLIDGYSQDGSQPPSESTPATIMINLDGSSAGGSGLEFRGAAASIGGVRGLAIYDFQQNGIVIETGVTGVQVDGNHVGLDASGTASGNGVTGVFINSATLNVVGGSDFANRNVISGHPSAGVLVSGGDGNAIRGNFIGTNPAGEAALGNTYGVYLTASNNDVVGGTAPSERNVISGNTQSGITVVNTRDSEIYGNYVGTDAGGAGELANSGDGIYVRSGTTGCAIGGNGYGQRNVISGNGACGVLFAESESCSVLGNYIGTDSAGTSGVPNALSGVYVEETSTEIQVGGSAGGEGNVISGNTEDGVRIESPFNSVMGNLIGTDSTGGVELANEGNGVLIQGECGENVVGGTVPGQGNVISGNGLSGVAVDGAFDTRVQGNLIGTDSSGDGMIPNMLGGVFLQNFAGRSIIGASGVTFTSGEGGSAVTGGGNVISGNLTFGVGVEHSPDTTIKGNLIGVGAGGTTIVPNIGYGVVLGSSDYCSIGGGPGEGNVISGNWAEGVMMSYSNECAIRGNLIGQGPDGSAMGNESSGVLLMDGSNTTALGGSATTGNVIANNAGYGVAIDASLDCDVSHNLIKNNAGSGVAVLTNEAFRNRVSMNSIFGNGELGISFGGGTAPTPNDRNNNNPDKPNRGYNYPEFASGTFPVRDGKVAVEGTAPPNAIVEIFSTGPGADPSGHGQGKTFLATVQAGATGAFAAELVGLAGGDHVSATATSPDGDPSGIGNTSEFSSNARVLDPRPRVKSVTPPSGPPGTRVTVKGENFGTTQGSSRITLGGSPVTVVSWSNTVIVFVVPPDSRGGAVAVTTAAGGSNTDKTFSISLPTWYLAEGTTAWGFDTYITIENPSADRLTARLTYMDPHPASGSGVISRRTVSLPPASQTTVDPRWDIDNVDFSTRVDCLEGKTIAVDRTMTWTGKGARSCEAHTSIGVNAPSETWYLPEGSSAWGFETWTLVLNPNDARANVKLTYMVEGRGPVTLDKTIPANSRATYSMARDVESATGVDASVEVVSDLPVVAERSMYRNDRREGHCSLGAAAPGPGWLLAEGSTAWGFTTYVLIQNPGELPAEISATYMTPEGPVEQPKFAVGPNSRMTVRVNDTLPPSDCSVRLRSSEPVVAERAMYWGGNTAPGEACHDSIGVTGGHWSFYLPDGQTSGGRETYTLVQNPNDYAVKVEVGYLPEGGGEPVAFIDTIPANSRRTYSMADRVERGRASVIVEVADPPGTIIVERSMYWNGRGAGTDTIGAFMD